MEGAGSRLGRSSSRYGGSTTTAALPTVFTGPVRRWKRQWVTTSVPDNTDNNRGQRLHDARPLHLCRWIPLPSTPSEAAAAADDVSHLPPKRKVLRYAPVTMLEEMKKEARTAGVDTKRANKSKAKLKERLAATFEESDDDDDDDDAADFVQDNEELMMEQAQVKHNHRFQNSQLYVNKF